MNVLVFTLICIITVVNGDPDNEILAKNSANIANSKIESKLSETGEEVTGLFLEL